MTQEKSQPARIPRHVAIIMDGNGRWARKRGLPRLAGHRAGTENIRRIVTECAQLGISCLTLYAFSTENWSRPSSEVDGLLRILSEFIARETDNLNREGAQIRHLGRLDNLSTALQRKIQWAIDTTRDNRRITLAVAFNYGGRAEIVDAVRKLVAAGTPADKITEKSIRRHLYAPDMPDPDLVVRTSGEHRISNFLLWELAYSELIFTETLWPDFRREHLFDAVREFQRRERRFGGVDE